MELCQGQIIPKQKMQELSSLFMTHPPNVMHAPVKFHEYIPDGLGVMARTRSGTYRQGRTDRHNWLVGCFGFLRQYFSLYRLPKRGRKKRKDR